MAAQHDQPTYELSERTTDMLSDSLIQEQLREEKWTYFPGGKAKFGAHDGDAPSDDLSEPVVCHACQRMARASRSAPRRVLRAIHDEMTDRKSIYSKLTSPPPTEPISAEPTIETAGPSKANVKKDAKPEGKGELRQGLTVEVEDEISKIPDVVVEQPLYEAPQTEARPEEEEEEEEDKCCIVSGCKAVM
ncbi:hypothetical protein LTR36_000353 [Oleoguttula mirabilis]|uniref:Uncharacterized protein n=1 Tax=Oleoguttula mirabilis TaxID=1507867 RepID=A0AAV9JYN9_9PEZI|nr:hypothetical protein LTR36_000353 [Oleoguttula mirabilis]